MDRVPLLPPSLELREGWSRSLKTIQGIIIRSHVEESEGGLIGAGARTAERKRDLRSSATFSSIPLRTLSNTLSQPASILRKSKAEIVAEATSFAECNDATKEAIMGSYRLRNTVFKASNRSSIYPNWRIR